MRGRERTKSRPDWRRIAGAQGSGDLTVNVSSATATISGKLKLAGSSDD